MSLLTQITDRRDHTTRKVFCYMRKPPFIDYARPYGLLETDEKFARKRHSEDSFASEEEALAAIRDEAVRWRPWVTDHTARRP